MKAGARRRRATKMTSLLPSRCNFTTCGLWLSQGVALQRVGRSDSGSDPGSESDSDFHKHAWVHARSTSREGSTAGPRRSVAVCVVTLMVLWIGLVGAQVPAVERAALVDLYTNTSGASWTNKAGWINYGVGSDPCSASWFGVTCSSSHIVYVADAGCWSTITARVRGCVLRGIACQCGAFAWVVVSLSER